MDVACRTLGPLNDVVLLTDDNYAPWKNFYLNSRAVSDNYLLNNPNYSKHPDCNNFILSGTDFMNGMYLGGGISRAEFLQLQRQVETSNVSAYTQSRRSFLFKDEDSYVIPGENPSYISYVGGLGFFISSDGVFVDLGGFVQPGFIDGHIQQLPRVGDDPFINFGLGRRGSLEDEGGATKFVL